MNFDRRKILSILLLILFSGCVGPADYAMMLRGAPKNYTEYKTFGLKADGVDILDSAEELGKSLNLKVTRPSHNNLMLSSDVGSFWGASGASSLSGEVRTVVITLFTGDYFTAAATEKGVKQVTMQVTVSSNTVDSRKEAEKIFAEFKTKLQEEIDKKEMQVK